MADNVGGQPFPSGDGPDSQDRAAADEVFAVVLDESFVEAAEIHEPTAAERILYAAMERAETEAAGELGFYRDPDLDPGCSDGLAALDGDPDPDGLDGLECLGGLEGLEELEGFEGLEDPDEEGRFDRSDYLRHPPDEPEGPDPDPGGYTFGGHGAAAIRGPGEREALPPAWRPARWQRPVACVLAMVMGISVVAFALIAVQRAGSARAPGPEVPASEPDQLDGDGAVIDAEMSEGDW